MKLVCLTSFQVAAWDVLFLAFCIDCAALWVCALAPSFLLHSYNQYLSLLVICDPFPFGSSLLLHWRGLTWNCSWGHHLLPCISLWSLSPLPTKQIVKWAPIAVSHMQLSVLGWSWWWRSAELLHRSPSHPSFKLSFVMRLMENRSCRWLLVWPALLSLNFRFCFTGLPSLQIHLPSIPVNNILLEGRTILMFFILFPTIVKSWSIAKADSKSSY